MEKKYHSLHRVDYVYHGREQGCLLLRYVCNIRTTVEWTGVCVWCFNPVEKKKARQPCFAFCWKHFANLQIKNMVIKRLILRFVFLEEDSERWEKKEIFRKRDSSRSIMTIESLKRWESQNRPLGEVSGAFPTPFLSLAIKWWRFVEHDTWLLCIMDLNGETKERANCFPCIQV